MISLNTATEYNSIIDLYGKNTMIFSTVGFIIGRLGVPLFLFLSGYLLLSKPINSIKDFYKKSLFPLIITITVWILLLMPLLNYFGNVNLKDLPYYLTYIKNVPYMQFWYVPFIVGVYIGIPFLNCIVHNFTTKEITPILCLIILFSILMPTLGILLPFSFPILETSTWFGEGYAVAYLLTGYYVGNNKIKIIEKTPNIVLILINIAAILIGACHQYLIFQNNLDLKYFYTMFPIFIGGLCIFTLLKRIKKPKKEFIINCFKKISIISFGCYFLHAPLQEVILRIGILNTLTPIKKILTLFFISTILTWGILLIIEKIPFVSNILLKSKIKMNYKAKEASAQVS